MRGKHCKTVDEVLEVLGTIDEVMALTDTKTPQAVYNWRSDPKNGRGGKFPAGLYLVMTTALAEKGYTADPALWRQHPPSSSGVEAANAAPAG